MDAVSSELKNVLLLDQKEYRRYKVLHNLLLKFLISYHSSHSGNPQFNPQAPVAQKTADEVVFRHFQGEEVDFLKSDLTDPPSDF